MWLADNWNDYTLIDCTDGEKLEYWGRILLRRPDPQAIWQVKSENTLWDTPDAWYHRNSSGGGQWEYLNHVPESWRIKYKSLTFNVKPMGFKHTGLFPEQAVNWDWFSALIKNAHRPIRLLNLFAYTGGATAAALLAGAEVVHVDASKGMVAWAKDNVKASGLANRPVRFIVDDVLKFVKREYRRGRRYEAIIMDPPSYGRGPSGEVWKIENELAGLVVECMKILSDEPLFFLINSYTTGMSQTVISNLLNLTLCRDFGGQVTSDEIGIPIKSNNLALPCGISTRWQAE